MNFFIYNEMKFNINVHFTVNQRFYSYILDLKYKI